MTPILNKRSIGEVGWGGKIPNYAELMRNVAFEIKSTPGFEDLSYQYFRCLRYISSVTVGCVNMWYYSGIKPSLVMQAPFSFFHCILKDEILARRTDLDCWSNSYYALPHINPQ